jgi:hypothetical protein
MLEFNTDEDLHTVMQYKRQVERENGYTGVICVDIDKLAELNEELSKKLTWQAMNMMGLPYNDNNREI